MKANLRPLLIPTLVIALVVLAGCSRERTLDSTQPEQPLLHGPLEDREAEDIACLISGEIVAPLELYEQVRRDLALLRAQFGGTVPALLSTKAEAPYFEPHFGLAFDETAFSDIVGGRHSEFDSLVQFYQMDVSFSGSYINVATLIRLNFWRVIESFERLRGFRSIWQRDMRMDGPRLYAHLSDGRIGYLLREAWGDCPSGCIYSNYHYFQVDNDTAQYYGSWARRWPSSPEPNWWFLARQALDLWAEGDPQFRSRDLLPPVPVTDLRIVEPQWASTVTVQFTAPEDVGLEPNPTSYVFRWGADSSLELKWYHLPYATFPAQPPGTLVTLILKGLPTAGRHFVGMRAADRLGNVSHVSNIIATENHLNFGWTHYRSSNSHLPNDHIVQVLLDSRGRTWVAAPTELSVLSESGASTFHPIDHPVFAQPVIALAESPSGEIWAGSMAGAASYDGAQWLTRWPLPGGLSDAEVRCISFDRDGGVWLGIGFSGAVRLAEGSWTHFTSSNSGIRGTIVRHVAVGEDGAAWFGGDKGLSRLHDGEWTPIGPEVTVTSLLPLHRDTILYGTHEGYLRRAIGGIEVEAVLMQPYEAWPQQHRAIASMAQSADGGLWLVSYGSLRRYTRDDLAELLVVRPDNSPLPEREITALVSGTSNDLWIGTRDSGLSRWDLTQAGFKPRDPQSRASADRH